MRRSGEVFRGPKQKNLMDTNTSESLSVRNALATIAARLRPCPSAGSGVHSWLYCAGLALRRAGHTEATACRAIRRAVEYCGREVPDREIQDAVNSAFNSKKQAPGDSWPDRNSGLIAEVASSGITLEDLRRRSPVDPATLTTDEIIDALFPGDPENVLICAGTTQKNGFHAPQERVPRCI